MEIIPWHKSEYGNKTNGESIMKNEGLRPELHKFILQGKIRAFVGSTKK